MSLTRILQIREVAAEFRKYVRVPSPGSSPPKLIAPLTGHTSYTLVGTAFDYCLRFCIAAYNPGLVFVNQWVAEIALDLIRKERHRLPDGLSPELAADGVTHARRLYNEFLASRLFTRPLARATLSLAALDRAYREGPGTVKTRYLRDSLRAQTDDCMRLVRAIPLETIDVKEKAVLNPGFGDASALVGGADADLLLDDTLVDIKTTKDFKITPAMVHQLVGYRILLAACDPREGIAQMAPRITHGAIYFSRYGRMERFPYLDLIDRHDFIRLADWLMNQISDDNAAIDLLISRVKNAGLC